MLTDQYPFESSEDFLRFKFKSIGPAGVVTKAVRYTETIAANIYNLGFGDMDETSGSVNDLVVTDNRDTRKVLTTVAQTLYVFTYHYPDAIVMATGSTDARTRLYQMGIANNLVAVEQDFTIWGYIENTWEVFQRNKTYHAFSVRRKRINL